MPALIVVLVALVCTSLVSAAMNQSVCQNGGVQYLCPTVATEYNSWGITFRSYHNFPFIMDGRPWSASYALVGAAKNLWLPLLGYVTGANANKTLVPAMYPRVLQLVFDRTGQPILVSMTVPLPYSINPPPQSTSNEVHAFTSYDGSTAIRAVLAWHDMATDDDIFAYHRTLIGLLPRHNVSFSNSSFSWASFTGPNSDEYYNEVWVDVLSQPPTQLPPSVPVTSF